MNKILFLLFTPRYSGAEIVIKNLIKNNKKIESYVLVSEDFTDKIGQNTFSTKYIKKLDRENNSILKTTIHAICNMYGLSRVLLKLQKTYQFNVIHVNNIALSIYSLPAALYLKYKYPFLKLLWHTHNINYVEGKWIKILEKLVFRVFDYTIVVSEAVREKINSNSPKVKLIYNGIDTHLFKYNPGIKRKLKQRYALEDNIIIGIFGSISLYKGQVQLLRAYKEVVKNFDSVHLFIIGSFESEEIKEQIIKFETTLGKNKLTVLDTVKNIYDYYSLTDIIVNNTSSELSEPLGTTILEGMATENIVVASKTGGTPEIIDDGIDGFMFKSDSAKELEEKLIYILKNFNDMKFIRSNAREKIVKKFNVKNMVESFNNIIGV